MPTPCWSRRASPRRDRGRRPSPESQATGTGLDQAFRPGAGDPVEDVIDLNHAAGSAPPGLVAAYQRAVDEVPAYLGGHGYFPAGVPRLQEAITRTYDERGLPTHPEQIMVTPGALSALGASVLTIVIALPAAYGLARSKTFL